MNTWKTFEKPRCAGLRLLNVRYNIEFKFTLTSDSHITDLASSTKTSRELSAVFVLAKCATMELSHNQQRNAKADYSANVKRHWAQWTITLSSRK